MIPRPWRAIMHIRNGRAYWKIIICHGGRCSSMILARSSGAGLGGISITLNSTIGGRRNVRTTRSILVAIPCALLPRLSPALRKGEWLAFPLFEPGTFDNRYVTVGCDIVQLLHSPGRPANFHAICCFVGTQTEMSRSRAR